MSEDAKTSMILCSGLEPAEQEKVERLDGLISEKFLRAGRAVRICQGRIDGDRRVLDFCGPAGTIASVWASDFLAASDADAVAMITPSFSG
jgi:hypothetical protein